MVKLLNKIIRCSILRKILDFIIDKGLSAFFNKTDCEFLLKLEKDSNIIAAKTQLHFFFHKTTYFKYGAAILRQ